MGSCTTHEIATFVCEGDECEKREQCYAPTWHEIELPKEWVYGYDSRIYCKECWDGLYGERDMTRENKRCWICWAVSLLGLIILSLFALPASADTDVNLVFGPGKSLEDANAGYLFGAVEVWRDAGKESEPLNGKGHRRMWGINLHYNAKQDRERTGKPPQRIEAHLIPTINIGWEWPIGNHKKADHPHYSLAYKPVWVCTLEGMRMR